MTDPYQQRQNPYGQQQPGGHGPNPHGGPKNPYGQGQPNPHGAQPNPRGRQPDPYGPGQPHQYGQQVDPYQTQRLDPYQTQQLDPYQTQQFDPGQTRPLDPGRTGPGGPGDQYGQYQGSYGQPSGWSQGGGRPPGPPRRSGSKMVWFSVLAVLVIVAGVVTAILLVGDGGSTPAAQATTTAPILPATTSRPAPATTTSPPAATSTASGATFEAGQCATLTPEPGSRATLNEALCGDSNSDVIVALVQDHECAKDYITFNADVGKVYCLALDAEEGVCFKFDQLAKRAQNCAAGTHKVAKIFESVTDSSRCDQVQGADRRYAYPEPARTVCLVPAA
jgi:hypothetical protein